jgi:pimeloyl-ACP methyl ester carboxylesterase
MPSLSALARCTAAAAAFTLAMAASSGVAEADFGPCAVSRPATTCERLTVPLDRSGGVPGSVSLFAERVASPQPSKGPIVVLAGGPGQAATPLLGTLEQVLAPALRDHDLVVFDQRGTGLSDRLDCPALDRASSSAQELAAVQECANGLGASRAFYTSRDNADDIDAVRQSLGVGRISLYGVSYGTFTALTYARRYRTHVESLVLDSVLAPGGRDPFDRSTLAAFPRVLRDICAAGCGGITHSPAGDLARLAAKVRKHPLKTSVVGPNGHTQPGTITEPLLVDLLTSGDFDPVARAEFPSVIASALAGDGRPLVRTFARELVTGGDQIDPMQTAQDSKELFFATECEETAFPWDRTAPLSSRPEATAAALAALPPSAFGPFDASTEARTGTTRPCLGWPDGSAESPLVTGTPADVPVLLLSGVDDTRTPVEDARATAALFPQARLVTVPNTGHSVVTTELGSCSGDALAAFFAGAPVNGCPATAPFVRPAPIAPRSLAAVRAAPGVGGARGKVLGAVSATLADARRQTLGYALTGTTIAAGGLRGGRMHGSLFGATATLTFSKLAYVPRVQVSGTATIDLRTGGAATARLTVSAPKNLKGELRLSGGRLSGRLGGRRVASRAVIAAAGARDGVPSVGALLRARLAAR